MDAFIIHSNADLNKVSECLKILKQHCFALNPLILKNGNSLWHLEARHKIQKAQMVILFVGANSYASPHIAWEIETAKKFKKPMYTVLLDPHNTLPAGLTESDGFSGLSKRYDKELSPEALAETLFAHESGNYRVFNGDAEHLDPQILLEQYKIFLQTSEDLVARRQSVNNFFITVNSALVAVFSFLFSLDMSLPYRMIISAALTVVGICLSVSWSRLLVSYGNLNSSKMKIISYIEKKLPASLYDAEWAALSDKLNRKKYVSFTNSEKRIPLLFIVVYLCIFVISTAVSL